MPARHPPRFALILLALASAAPALAQRADDYPTKPVRMIVPYAPGGPLDVIGRLVIQKLTESFGQSVILDNRPGANGIIGTELVARSARDGYTMLYQTGSHAANPSLYRKLPYDSVRDFAPITQIAQAYGQLLVVHPSLPVKTTRELVAMARAKPGHLNYAHAGTGNATHLAAEMLFTAAGIRLTPVPYKGGGPALNDVIAGQVEMMFVSLAQGLPFVKAGRVRPVVLSGPKRAPQLPDVPTFQEAGYAGLEFAGWHGLWFPAGTPRERVERMQREVARIVQLPDVKPRFDEAGLMPVGSTPEAFAANIQREMALLAKVAQAAKIEPQ